MEVLCPPLYSELLAEDMECLRGAAGCCSLLLLLLLLPEDLVRVRVGVRFRGRVRVKLFHVLSEDLVRVRVRIRAMGRVRARARARVRA